MLRLNVCKNVLIIYIIKILRLYGMNNVLSQLENDVIIFHNLQRIITILENYEK